MNDCHIRARWNERDVYDGGGFASRMVALGLAGRRFSAADRRSASRFGSPSERRREFQCEVVERRNTWGYSILTRFRFAYGPRSFITDRTPAFIGDCETLCAPAQARGVVQMPFVGDELEVLTAWAAEYKLISDLATDPLKRQQYNWLARELQDLLKRAQVERAKMKPPGAANPSAHADR